MSNSLVYFYTYWNDYKSIAIAKIKRTNSNLNCFSRAHRADIYYEINTENYLPFKEFIFQVSIEFFHLKTFSKLYE